MAIDIACDNNKRSWAYIRGILNNWIKEGKPVITRPAIVFANAPPETRLVSYRDPDSGELVQREIVT